MIVITGAAGFISSVVLGYLNKQGFDDIGIVDNFKNIEQIQNLQGKNYSFIGSSPKDFYEKNIEAIIHFGANSSTLEKSWESIYETNVKSTRQWADLAREKKAKMIFASTAAVYGNGNGPINLYALSKLASEKDLNDMVCLRLFNVYGPNEYHKSRMASTVFHWYNQYLENKEIKIFENSETFIRDFVWVEDVARVVDFFLKNYQPGVYDLGSGHSISFNDLADIVCENLEGCAKKVIEMPSDLKNQYQKLTVSKLQNLQESGFDTASLIHPKIGVSRYIGYLKTHSYY